MLLPEPKSFAQLFCNPLAGQGYNQDLGAEDWWNDVTTMPCDDLYITFGCAPKPETLLQ